MNTTENNILLAEFMGWLTKDHNGVIKQDPTNDLFHKDWNWLMMVVENIETLEIFGRNPEFFIMYDKRDEFKGWYWNIEVPKKFKKDCLRRELTKIEAVYNACLAFVKWHAKEVKTEES